MTASPDTSAILVCAGSASRMQGKNKILLPLGTQTVVGTTMAAFQQCERIAEIVVVARPCDQETIAELAKQGGITKLRQVVSGGATRQESVIQGLRAIAKETAYIAVHDGARPLVTPEQISRTIRDASVFGGAVLGVPVKDTIKVVEDELIVDTPDRSKLYQILTPQVFRRSIYFEAVDFALEHQLDFTDDCQLVEAMGCKVFLTKGDYTNLKITTPEDIDLAQLLLERRSRKETT